MTKYNRTPSYSHSATEPILRRPLRHNRVSTWSTWGHGICGGSNESRAAWTMTPAAPAGNLRPLPAETERQTYDFRRSWIRFAAIAGTAARFTVAHPRPLPPPSSSSSSLSARRWYYSIDPVKCFGLAGSCNNGLVFWRDSEDIRWFYKEVGTKYKPYIRRRTIMKNVD